MTQVDLFSDGACSGNPGPGGWGCVLKFGKTLRKLSGYEPESTNNRMELMAVISGLRALARPCSVLVTTDSMYVKNAFTEGWLDSWIKKNWRTAAGSSVKNQDLWLMLIEQSRIHTLEWQWVKGHAGHEYNEMCDTLARLAIKDKCGIDERSQLE